MLSADAAGASASSARTAGTRQRKRSMPPERPGALRLASTVVVDVVAERLEAVRARVAEVAEAVEVLDAAQQRVVVVGRRVDRAGLDERGHHDGAGAPAPGAGDDPARVDRVVA